MDIKQLQYVAALSELKSYTKTAEKFHISQPTLSQQILRLEDEIGFPLFIRSTRSVTPTDEGVYFITHAQHVLSAWDNLNNSISELTHTGGNLNIGLFMQAEFSPIPNILAAFSAEHPQCHIGISMGNEQKMLTDLKEMRIDVLLIRCYKEVLPDWIRVTPLYEDPCYILLNHDDPMAAAETVTHSDVADYQVICERSSLTNSFDAVSACFNQNNQTLPFPLACTETANVIPFLLQQKHCFAITTRQSSVYITRRYPHITARPFLSNRNISTYILTRQGRQRKLIKQFCYFVTENCEKFSLSSDI